MSGVTGDRRRNWTEILIFVLLFSAIFLWYRSSRDLRFKLQQVIVQRDSIQFGLNEARNDASRFRSLAKYSVLDTSVELVGVFENETLKVLKKGSERIRPTILYSMDPACASCTANLPFVDSITTVAPCPIQLVGVFVASEAKQRNAFTGLSNFPIVVNASGSAWEALSLHEVPILSVIGRSRGVRGIWSGALTPTDKGKILHAVRDICNEI